MNICEIFSKNLVHFRKAKGFSQSDLADKTKLTQRIITYYENKPQSVPFENLQVIADILGASITDFFEDTKEKSELESIDIRWIKKIYEIRQLPHEDQKEINRHINYLVEKNRLKKTIIEQGKKKK